MEEYCAMCREEIDVPVFRRTPTTVTEGDCTRMECGHALHTTCLINSLQVCRGKCLLCNVDRIMDDMGFNMAEHQLRFEAECFTVLETIKKKKEVKEALALFRKDSSAFTQKLREYKKRVKEYKKQLKEELDVKSVMNAFKSSRALVKRTIKEESKKESTLHGAAIRSLSTWTLDKWLFGKAVYRGTYGRYAFS